MHRYRYVVVVVFSLVELCEEATTEDVLCGIASLYSCSLQLDRDALILLLSVGSVSTLLSC